MAVRLLTEELLQMVLRLMAVRLHQMADQPQQAPHLLINQTKKRVTCGTFLKTKKKGRFFIKPSFL
jgi:hypothetical protein